MNRLVLLIESNTTGTGPLLAQAFQRLGFKPVLLTAQPDRYDYVQSDRIPVRQVDTLDPGALLTLSQALGASECIAGVTSSSDYFIGTAAALAQTLGLSGPSASAIECCRNKLRQRQILEAAGIAGPRFQSARSPGEALAAARQIGFPVILKPASGSGSIGVRLCPDAEVLMSHAQAVLSQRENERGIPLPRYILVEEIVHGPEYSVELFGRDVLGVTRKRLGPEPFFVETGHVFPAPVSAVDERAIAELALRATAALGLIWGPTHVEIRRSSMAPAIIEVNPRLAGGYIPELVRLATGVDLLDALARLVVGQQPSLARHHRRHAGIRFILPPYPGMFDGAEELRPARRLPGIVEARLYARTGDRLTLRGDFRDRIGHIIAVGDSAAAVDETLEGAVRLIQLRIENGRDAELEAKQ